MGHSDAKGKANALQVSPMPRRRIMPFGSSLLQGFYTRSPHQFGYQGWTACHHGATCPNQRGIVRFGLLVRGAPRLIPLNGIGD